MTEAIAPYTPETIPETPYTILRELIARRETAKQELDAAEKAYKAICAEVNCLAQNIYTNKIKDDTYALAPTYTQKRSVTRVDNNKLRESFPEIFEKANPHVDGDGAWAILNSIYTAEELQPMLKDIKPDIFKSRAKVTKAALQDACTAEEMQQLEAAGVLVTSISFTEEPNLIRKDLQQARIEGAKKRAAARTLKAAEDMEDEE